MPCVECDDTVGKTSGLRRFLLVCFLGAPSLAAAQTDIAGSLSVEPRFFLDPPAFAGQSESGLSPSVVAAPEFRYEWNDSSDRLTIAPFLRLDADDDERTHFDLREANWQHIANAWTFRLGLDQVFWGVTESRHLVNIINQIDQVEDIDEEDRLGQPMISVERYSDYGTLSAFLLLGFRERTFPADDARLRGPLPVATELTVYESSRKDRHTDMALRWEQSIGDWDFGVAGFYGTGREPRLVPDVSGSGIEVLVPHYDLISQLGLDLQYTRGAWLWKLEAIRRSGQGRSFGAYTAGFEYTIYAIRQTNADLGLLVERLYDGRDTTAPATALADDVFIGARLALNDVNDTMLLFGAIIDRDDHGIVSFIEGQRRIWDRWRLEAELRLLDDAEGQVLRGLRGDSFLTLRLARFF